MLVGLGVVMAGIVMWQVLRSAVSARQDLAQTVPFDERVKSAFDLRQETSRGLFEVTILLTGALWGLVIARGSFSSWGRQEAILFVLANAGLLFSLSSHLMHSMDMTRFLTDAAVLTGKALVPDFFGQKLGFKFDWQVASFFSGAITTGLVFLSGKLKS